MSLAQAVSRCYQCGKCTAGCPQAERMDLAPNQVLRLIQLGHTRRATQSNAIWKCVSCLTCSGRCPQEVDCAGVMDELRRLATTASGAVPIFQRAFLRNIRRHGRLNEMELIGTFKTKAFLKGAPVAFLFQEASLVPALYARDKLHLRGGKSPDCTIVDRIFTRCGE